MARKKENKLMPRLMNAAAFSFRSFCRFIVLTAIMAGTMLILIDMGRFFFQSADFTVKEISVEGNIRISQEEIQSLAEIVPGTNIWLVDTGAMQQRILNHPTVSQSYVQRIPPHRLHIRVIERQTIASIWNKKEERFYGIDNSGVIFTVMPDKMQSISSELNFEWEDFLSYPILSLHEEFPVRLGETIVQQRVQETLILLQKLKMLAPKFFLSLSECEIQQDETIILHPKRRIGAMILRNLDSPDLAKKIAAFWNVLEVHDLRVIYADARFPRHGFAVRWDESDGSRWKKLYQNEASVISSL